MRRLGSIALVLALLGGGLAYSQEPSSGSGGGGGGGGAAPGGSSPCADDEILRTNGSAWQCEAAPGAGSGDDVSVNAGDVTNPDFADTSTIAITDTSNTLTWDFLPAGAESGLEAVLDIPDLQGYVASEHRRIRVESDCSSATGGVTDELCLDTEHHLWRCPDPGDCSVTTDWVQISVAPDDQVGSAQTAELADGPSLGAQARTANQFVCTLGDDFTIGFCAIVAADLPSDFVPDLASHAAAINTTGEGNDQLSIIDDAGTLKFLFNPGKAGEAPASVDENGIISAKGVDIADANTDDDANTSTLLDNDTDLTTDPTCANVGIAGRLTLVDTDESASDSWTFCDGTSTLADLSALAGASGTLTTLKEATSQVGGADIVSLDFGAGFDLTETPDTEINVELDISEISSGTLADARVATTITRDSEATEHCESGGITSPDNTDRIVPGLPYAVTITQLSCTVEGSTPSITVGLDECDSAGANCANGGISVTCDGGVDTDTTFTDAAFDADDAWRIDTGAESGTVDYVSWRICYSRPVVSTP